TPLDNSVHCAGTSIKVRVIATEVKNAFIVLGSFRFNGAEGAYRSTCHVIRSGWNGKNRRWNGSSALCRLLLQFHYTAGEPDRIERVVVTRFPVELKDPSQQPIGGGGEQRFAVLPV